MNFKTASSLLESSSIQKIFTGVGVLDKSLRGGISIGKVTQLVGKPGAGKTQMWQVPKMFEIATTLILTKSFIQA